MSRPIDQAPPATEPQQDATTEADRADGARPENRNQSSDSETERRDRVIAAIGRFEDRPKRPSWWGRR